MTRIYLFPCEEVGRAPMISQDCFLNGRDEVMVPNSAGGLGWGGYAFDIDHTALSRTLQLVHSQASKNTFWHSPVSSLHRVVPGDHVLV